MNENDFYNAYNEIKIRAYRTALAVRTYRIPRLKTEIDPSKVKQKAEPAVIEAKYKPAKANTLSQDYIDALLNAAEYNKHSAGKRLMK